MNPLDDDWIDDLAESEHQIHWCDRLDAMPVGWRAFVAAVVLAWLALAGLAWLAIGWLL